MPSPHIDDDGSGPGLYSDLVGDGALAITNGPNATFTDPASLRWMAPDKSQVVVRTPGDSATVGDGVWNVQHGGDTGYILHMGVAGSGGAAIGIGVGYTGNPSGGTGLLVDNWCGGIGILLQNLPSITDATSKGFYGVQNSEIAPLLEFQQARNDAAVLARFVGRPSGTGRLTEWVWNAGASLGGYVSAVDGSLRWTAPIVAESGAPTIRLESSSSLHRSIWDTGAGNRIRFYQFSGTPDLYYASQMVTATDEWKFQVAVQPAGIGSETMLDAINLKGGAFATQPKIGFFGAAPVVKPTGVAVTAAGIHAALVSLGLIAA